MANCMKFALDIDLSGGALNTICRSTALEQPTVNQIQELVGCRTKSDGIAVKIQ